MEPTFLDFSLKPSQTIENFSSRHLYCMWLDPDSHSNVGSMGANYSTCGSGSETLVTTWGAGILDVLVLFSVLNNVPSSCVKCNFNSDRLRGLWCILEKSSHPGGGGGGAAHVIWRKKHEKGH